MAEALYRKYRPQVFEDVVGQEPIERTLKNAIAQDKVSHAYLFCGPRGTGKTTTARLLAKALLCEQGPTPDPDGACEDCQLIADGVHPDVYELDAASRTGVENVREEIISRVSFAPTRGRYKVYIIDEVHMLSTAAFNALLKTLEEPPSHVVFVLCTTDPQKVPETIHSRCQRFDFRRIAPESMVSRLGAICIAEDVEFEGEALDLIAHRADGGLRNALTSLEQIIAFENGKVTLAGAERLLGSIDSNDMAEIMAYVGKRDIANCFRWTAAYVETGADLAQFVRDMAEHVRNLYVLALVGDDADIDVNETQRRELVGELQWFGADRLARLLGVLGDLSAELKTSSNPRLAFEIALTRMVRPDSDLTLESLAERVEALESGYSAVAHVLPGNPVGAGAAVESQAAQGGREAFAGSGEVYEDLARAIPEPSAQSGYGMPAVAASAVPAAAQSTPAPAQASVSETRQASTAVPNVAQAQGSGVAFDGGSAAAGTAPAGVSAQDVAAQGVAASSPLANQAALQRIWQAAMTALKKYKQAYGVLFMSAKARYSESAGAVRVIFPPESTFAFNAVQKSEVQEALAQALEKAAGMHVAFVYEQSGNAAPAVSTQASYAAPVAQPAAQQAAAQPAAQPAYEQPVSTAAPAASGQGSSPSTAANQAVSADAAPAFDGARQATTPSGQGISAAAQVPAESPAHVGPIDEVPYDQVPYEDAPYEPVPYEEFDSMPASAQDFGAASPSSHMQAQAAPAATSAQSSVADATSSASPSASSASADGAVPEDPSDVQALLQAGFGGGVVFSEVDE